MSELKRIKENVAKMVQMGAPEDEIDDYIGSEGVTVDDVKNFNPDFQNEIGLPKLEETEAKIAGREDSVKRFIDEIKYTPDLKEHPVKGAIDLALKPAVTGLKAAAIPFQKAEAAVANVLLEAQKGNLEAKNILESALGPAAMAAKALKPAMQGITGERSGEIGDLVRTTGFGGRFNEPLAAGLGLAATSILPGKIKEKIKVVDPEIAKQRINTIPNKFFRGGLTKEQALNVEKNYGSSNGALVETVKTKIGEKIAAADDAYGQVFSKAPDNKFIDIHPAIEQAKLRLKKLGLITDSGKLTQTGQSEIMRDSTYAKLLDFYQSADSLSGVKELQGKALTQSQIIKASKAMKETLVNKEQYLFLRDKLNSLYKGKPSDIDVGKVLDYFYQTGENSGLKGLQAARKLEREAFKFEEKFLNRKTGDLRIATEAKLNRVGTEKPLSQAEMQHIAELEKYIDHPIIKDANAINKLNEAKQRIKNIKKYGKYVAGGAIAGEIGRKVVTGSF